MMQKSVALLVLLLSGTCGFCEKKITSITTRQEKRILAQADETFNSYARVLRNLALDITKSEIDVIVDRAFTNGTKERIFNSDRFFVDDEIAPGFTRQNPQKIEVKQYLQQFNSRFGHSEENIINCKKTSTSKIRIIGAGLEIKIGFTQSISGTYSDGRPMDLNVQKVMALLAVRASGDKWTTLIYAIDRASSPDLTKHAPLVAISDAAGKSVLPLEEKPRYSENFYEAMLQRGQLQQGNVATAYYSLLEAQNGERTSGKATALIDELIKKLRDSEQEDPGETLSKRLVKLAQDEKKRFRYDLARKYYEYAYKADQSKTLIEELETISDIEQKLKQLTGQLDRGLPNEALKDARIEIEKDPENPLWYIVKARAYEQLKQPEDADAAFNTADAKSNHPEIARWQAAYFKHRLDYARAYDKLRTLQGRTEDPWDPAIKADIAYCKGRALLAQDPPQPREALDSFNMAMIYQPGNKATIVAQAEALILLREHKKAKEIIRNVLDADDAIDNNTLGDAWHLSGIICEWEEKNNEALKAFEQAVYYRNDMASYFYDLGILQSDMEKYDDALMSLNKCIKIRNPLLCREMARIQQSQQLIAVWKIGKCYYLMGNDNEAKKNYEDYYKQSLKGYIQPDFYADIANLFLRRSSWKVAADWLAKVKTENANTLLSRSILSYFNNKDDRVEYERLADDAFDRGLRKSQFLAAPNIRSLYRDSKHIRTIVREKWHIKKMKR